ncbi:hypothetical protein D3C85_1581320 [compost metagenome]
MNTGRRRVGVGQALPADAGAASRRSAAFAATVATVGEVEALQKACAIESGRVLRTGL